MVNEIICYNWILSNELNKVLGCENNSKYKKNVIRAEKMGDSDAGLQEQRKKPRTYSSFLDNTNKGSKNY